MMAPRLSSLSLFFGADEEAIDVHKQVCPPLFVCRLDPFGYILTHDLVLQSKPLNVPNVSTRIGPGMQSTSEEMALCESKVI